MGESSQFEHGKGPAGPVLTARGEIDMAVAEQFQTELLTLIDHSKSPAFVDLSDVTFMDSTGVNALAAARRRAVESDVELVLIDPSRPVRLVLEATGLWAHFRVE
jgi:anti-sigma B factor antagonist